jgi:pimeloyl-ACP methyl ester carboxylesterase
MRHWALQVAALSSGGANVVAFDSPGNGLAERTRDRRAFEFDRIVEQGIDLLDHLGMSQADVVGFSRGVAYALTMATRFPKRVGRLILIGGAVDPDAPWTRPPPSTPAAATAGDDAQRLETFYRRCFNEPDGARFIAPAIRWGLEGGPGLLELADYGLDIAPALSTSEIVHGAQGPALLIHGEHDAVAPVRFGRALAAARPDFQALWVPGRGHAPHLTAAEPIADAVARFLGLPAQE